MICKSQMFEKFILDLPHLFKIIIRPRQYIGAVMLFRQYYWIRRRRSSSKNLQRFAYSSRHRLLILLEWAEMEIDCLQRNNTFKWQITLDRHNASRNLNKSVLPDPPHFLLPSTFKGVGQPWYKIRRHKGRGRSKDF